MNLNTRPRCALCRGWRDVVRSTLVLGATGVADRNHAVAGGERPPLRARGGLGTSDRRHDGRGIMTTAELNELLLYTEESLRAEIAYLEERVANLELLVARPTEKRAPRAAEKRRKKRIFFVGAVIS